MFLKISQNSQENTCARVSFLIKLQASACAQVFSCEFCGISKNIFFYRTLPVTACFVQLFRSAIRILSNIFHDAFRKNSRLPGVRRHIYYMTSLSFVQSFRLEHFVFVRLPLPIRSCCFLTNSTQLFHISVLTKKWIVNSNSEN